MNNATNFFDVTFKRDVYDAMLNSDNNTNLIETLIDLQGAYQIPRDQAEINARACVTYVASCESVRDRLSENSAAVLDHIFESMKAQNDTERDTNLHRMYFGVTVYQNDNLIKMLDQGVSIEELFWRYYKEQSEQEHRLTEDELKEQIRGAMDQFDLSPEVLKAIAKKTEMSGNWLATWSALGEGGNDFKCIVAMEIYMAHQGEMSMHDAANLACYGVQVQAVADAVGKGILTREKAKKILMVAAIAAVIIGVGILIYSAGAAAVVETTATEMATVVLSMPQPTGIFAEFANPALANSPYYSFVHRGKLEAIAAELAKEAFQHKVIGTVVAVAGIVLATVSDKLATFVGKLTPEMLRKDTACVAEGLGSMVKYLEDEQMDHVEEATPIDADDVVEVEDIDPLVYAF